MMNIFFKALFTEQERRTRRFKWIQIFMKDDFKPDRAAVVELFNVLETEDLRGVLGTIGIPVQFINGTDDYICQKELYEEIKVKMPNLQSHSSIHQVYWS